MFKKTNWTVLLVMLAISSISGGMALKSTFEYSPTFGWLLGFVCFLSAGFVATKKLKSNTN
ncbi:MULTISPECIES: hypothetical protein [Metabacillus]|uniref:Uncharacterized protein n=3 Tax=Metabacillus TaxID=2675233 RepID=A0A179SR18_9BACI|nr:MULTISPECIES: hypothetical protein [Metabacillus]OAS82732.1 hypothetical protein A6K24_11455 [Metabacillus litoralis]QNF30172.1 hypothetical protein HUW50_23550 [Metabacillus sp. KUDC1714]